MKFSRVDALLAKNNKHLNIKDAGIVEGRLVVTWEDGSTAVYPLVYLRDICPCVQCFNPVSNSKVVMFEHLESGIEVKSLKVQNDSLTVEWINGHTGSYSATWLYNRRLDKEGIEHRLREAYPTVIDEPWPTNIPSEVLKRASYEDILNKPETIVNMVECLIRDGVFIIENAPTTNCLVEFLKEIECVHNPTHYGSPDYVVYDPTVIVDAKPNSAKKLELHIDHPYLTRPSQIQLLQCQVQSEDGGENKLTDALKAALILKEKHPEDYRVLSTVKVDYQFSQELKGVQWFILNRATVIGEEERTGLPTLCRYADEGRCSIFNQPPEVVEQWYKAFGKFWKILEENSFLTKSKPGDIIMFNNGRVMHAREAFNPTQHRRLGVSYADWDFMISSWRLAKAKLTSAGSAASA